MNHRSLGSADVIERLGPWFHNLHLPDGAQTRPDHPLGDFPSFKWQALAPHVPDDLRGKRAVDIGCNAGFYSFELAKRGADVLAIDVDDRYLDQARWAADQYGLAERIRFEKRPIYSLHREQPFDLVLFMGVFYHLRHPLLALDIVASKVGGTLVFQTLTMPGQDVFDDGLRDRPLDDRYVLLETGWPKMAFIEHRMAEDPTNWWAPNHACVEALLRTCGMRVRARPAHEVYVCTPDGARDPVTKELVDDELRQVLDWT